MKILPQVLFWLGLISVPFAWLVWYLGPQMEMVRPVLASISDCLTRHSRRSRILDLHPMRRAMGFNPRHNAAFASSLI
jgi:hypothetical protein